MIITPTETKIHLHTPVAIFMVISIFKKGAFLQNGKISEKEDRGVHDDSRL